MSEEFALSHSTRDFLRPEGVSFDSRSEPFSKWIASRIDSDLYQYGRTLAGKPGPMTPVFDDKGRASSSLNFASQDYLGLASDQRVVEAAISAMREYGLHSAGSPMVIGETALTKDLAESLAEHLQMEHVLVYPTGWAAGFGAITGLVRSYDYIVMDKLAHACLQIGAVSTTAKILKHEHLDRDALEITLASIRGSDSTGGILVVNEGLFSMDADSPDLKEFREVCREYNATLLVDVAHDLGAVGPGGTGEIGKQGMLGKIDIVMGSFSKTFASNGGFVATNSRSVYEYLRMFSNSYMFSNALSPVQAATVLKTLEIVRSERGDFLRQSVLSNALAMRKVFVDLNIRCYGCPSPIVPVHIGEEKAARLVYRDLRNKGISAMVIEFPIVAVSQARLRIQLMANHTKVQCEEGARIIGESIKLHSS